MPKSYIKKSKQTKNIKNKTKKVKTRKVKKVKTHKIIYKGGLGTPRYQNTGEPIFGTALNPSGQSVEYTFPFGHPPTYASVQNPHTVNPLTGQQSNGTLYATVKVNDGAPGRPIAPKPTSSPGRPSVRPPAYLLEGTTIVCDEPTPCKQKVGNTFICVSC
jgi:hypothetical protein